MNLATHGAVLWRFRAVTATGLLLAVVLAVLASYQVSFDGGPSLKARGTSTWASESALLVTQPGFPEGRVVLPTSPPEELVAPPKDRIEFGDPNRFNTLTDLYSQLATSDQVLRQIASRPKPTQITAVPVPGLAGAPVLPIIRLTTEAPTADAARKLNVEVSGALGSLLTSEQDKAKIGEKQRVQLQTLKAPSTPIKTAGPSHTGSILAFLLCIIGTIAVTHLLAVIRQRNEDDDLEDLVLSWDADDERDDIRRDVETEAQELERPFRSRATSGQ
jgi:hypothetical protein